MDSKRYALAEIADINAAQYSPKEKWPLIQYLDTGSVTRGHIDALQQLKPGVDKIPGRARRRVKQGSIVYSMVRPNQEHYALLEHPPANMLASTGFAVIDAKSDVVLPEYLYYSLIHPDTTAYFQALAEQVVSTYPTLGRDDLAKFEIDVPGIEEQHAITTLLATLDKKIALSQRTNDYLAESALCIWKRRVQQSSEHMIIGEAAKEVITGKTPPTKRTELYGSDYPFITIPDMHGNVWFTSTERCLSEEGNKAQPKKIVDRGTVLVSCIATLGLVGIVSKPSHFNQQINAVVPKRAGEEYFLYCALLSIKQTLLGIGATGSATLNVNKGAFSGIDIPWLDDKSMDEYIQTVRPLFEAVEANSIECLRLTSLRDTLLPKLMSGEIDVSGIEATMPPNNHL